jgi:hypothetical protein
MPEAVPADEIRAAVGPHFERVALADCGDGWPGQ